VSAAELVRVPPDAGPASELRKLGAFARRDFLIAWSYRMAFFSEWLVLALQTAMFYFIGQLVNPDVLPEYGGTHATYMEFVSIGIVMAAMIQIGFGRVAAAVRGEQLTGTLESLLLTPTALATIQVGTVLYDFAFIPVRMGLFLVVVAELFGLHFYASGALPAVVFLLVLLPFVWGLGVANAAGVLTFRRGFGAGLAVSVLALSSGAYFPLSVLPTWLQDVARLNPIAVSLGGVRSALLSDEGWAVIDWRVAVVACVSLLTLVLGLAAFRLALRRERRRGSLGLY